MDHKLIHHVATVIKNFLCIMLLRATVMQKFSNFEFRNLDEGLEDYPIKIEKGVIEHQVLLTCQ